MIKKTPIIDINTGQLIKSWSQTEKTRDDVWLDVEDKVHRAQISHASNYSRANQRGYASPVGKRIVHTVRLQKKLRKAGFHDLSKKLDQIYLYTRDFLLLIYKYPHTPTYIKKMIEEGQIPYHYRLGSRPEYEAIYNY